MLVFSQPFSTHHNFNRIDHLAVWLKGKDVICLMLIKVEVLSQWFTKGGNFEYSIIFMLTPSDLPSNDIVKSMECYTFVYFQLQKPAVWVPQLSLEAAKSRLQKRTGHFSIPDADFDHGERGQKVNFASQQLQQGELE